MNIPKLPRPLHAMLPGMFFLVAAATTSLPAQRITVSDPKATPIVVESASINTEVTGRIAVTTFDLVFRNPNNRVLEGSFEFPLLEGQKVVGFGLDLNGRVRDAVPVEKERGRAVFEQIVRRKVDPALLEQTAGNNYRARIFPLPATGTRRVVITYQEDLALKSDEPVYRLALNFQSPLDTFRLTVNVPSADTALAKARTTLPFEIPAWQAAKLLEINRTNFAARGIFELELPQAKHPQVLTERRGGTEYFYAEIPVAALKPATRPTPSVVGLLWDASGSGRERDHARELDLLDAWFTAVPNVEVRLVVFRNQAATPLSFKIENGNWTKLRNELKKMVYDGATSFDGLTDDATVGEWLMFSDGLVNYGVAQATATLPLRAPVHTVLASSQADPALLRGLAQRQAGEFINLLSTTPATAARLLRNESLRVLELDYNPEEFAQVFPERNAPVGDGALIVTGILRTKMATLRIQLGRNATDAKWVDLTVHSSENPSRLAARGWATTKIASLETDIATNRDDIRRTSQEFGIVTANTSLIVLETLQDYLRYDIAPPEELRADWEANRRNTNNTRWKGSNSNNLNSLARLFADRLRWWDPSYPVELLPTISAPTPFSSINTGPTTQTVAQQIPVPDLGAPGFHNTITSELPESYGEEVIVLSPFTIESSEDAGYSASSTLAGTRMRTELRDVGSSISTITNRFLQDTAAASSNDVLVYTANTEVAGAGGNFSGDPDTTTDPAAILLKHWEPNAGYLNRLRRTAPEKRYAVYLEERSDHGRQPGFFLDVAEFFFAANQPDLALRILSNLAELQLEDSALLRVLAHRLVQAGRPELALPLFERVLTLRPEEPQSRRDLALACTALKQHQRAVDLLWEIVSGSWDARFPEIEAIALGELNAIVATCGEPLDLSRIDHRFLQNLPVGLRVILTWDTDDCDIDLWVKDPNGEEANFSHPRTAQGGRMSRDFTGGYGPEEFLLRDPKPGKYTVRINYYGDSRQTALGPVTAQIRLITGFGTPNQKEKTMTMRLGEEKDNITVGEIEIGQ